MSTFSGTLYLSTLFIKIILALLADDVNRAVSYAIFMNESSIIGVLSGRFNPILLSQQKESVPKDHSVTSPEGFAFKRFLIKFHSLDIKSKNAFSGENLDGSSSLEI